MDKNQVQNTTPKNRFFLGLLVILALTYINLARKASQTDNLVCPIAEPAKIYSPVLQNRERLGKILGNGIVLLPSAPRAQRPGSDMELPGWRQTSNIIYVMGKYEIADSYILVNTTNNVSELTVFLPDLLQKEIVFNGDIPDKEAIKKDYLLKEVFNVKDMATVLQGSTIFSPSNDILAIMPETLQNDIISKNSTIEYSSVIENSFVESRFLKTENELKYMKFASETAFYSHARLEAAIKGWSVITESTLAAYFRLVSTICKCHLQAYNPIVGAGKHSGVLHYPTGESIDGGSSQISSGEYILVDAAGAYNGYASDLTRTYLRAPDSKKEKLIEIVQKANYAGVKELKIGNKWSQVVNACLHSLLRGLWENDFLIADSLQELIASGVISIFMPHGVGHPIGLDVHDPYPKRCETAQSVGLKGLTEEYPLKLAHDYELESGQVHTVEPVIYI